MTWIKLNDNTTRHPKVCKLSDKAFRFWIASLCYAGEFLTDGSLPVAFLVTVKRTLQDEILDAGLWKVRSDGTIEIHDYLHHQARKEDVEDTKARNRDKAAKYRAKMKAARLLTGNVTGVVTLNVTNPDTDTDTEAEKKNARPRPLIAKRNFSAEYEHERFDVPTSWHVRTVKGLHDGEARLLKFYRWLSDRVERTNEDTLPRFEWLDRCFKEWLDTSTPQRSAVPSPEETRKMIADRIAMAGK
jgi:hypothetical protein